MKFISTYSLRPGCIPEAAKRFLSGQAEPPEGIKILGRWHRCDVRGGVLIMECDDAAAMHSFALSWAECLEMSMHPAVEDAELGAALAKQYGG